MQAYFADAFADRLWVDLVETKDFTANILTIVGPSSDPVPVPVPVPVPIVSSIPAAPSDIAFAAPMSPGVIGMTTLCGCRAH